MGATVYGANDENIGEIGNIILSDEQKIEACRGWWISRHRRKAGRNRRDRSERTTHMGLRKMVINRLVTR